mmetsp:Transcript_31886/g.63152  ORF Transcript_31886/g.63152 Transcript_31886/m.63152 type:complete len:92 (+) Transcript_31886:1328-1603(+)
MQTNEQRWMDTVCGGRKGEEGFALWVQPSETKKVKKTRGLLKHGGTSAYVCLLPPCSIFAKLLSLSNLKETRRNVGKENETMLVRVSREGN